MRGGRTKVRFTVAVDPEVARIFDTQVRSRQIPRGLAAEEAFAEWARRQVMGHWDDLGRTAAGDPSAVGLPDEATIASWMVLQALRFQFPAMRDLGDEQLRILALRAIASQEWHSHGA